MRHLILPALVVALSGCGAGATPELYALVVEYFRPNAACYSSGTAPTEGVASTAPGLIHAQVWDGPDATAVLQVESGGGSVDMGSAPNVDISGLFTGTKGDKGWTFASETVESNEVLGALITDTTRAEFTFDRANTFKGTATLSSKRTCTGTGCPTMPSCTISGVKVTGTRIAVDYERAP